MTTQMKDLLWLDGSQHPILDISDGKVLSCKECVGEAFGAIATACYRDSFAEYEVDDRILVLKETAAHAFDDMPSISEKEFYKNRKPPRCETGAVIPFTGFLILYEGGYHIDWFSDVFRTDWAIELEFEEGLLVDQVDLASFIREGRRYIELLPKGEDGLCADCRFFNDCDYMMSVMGERCEHLPRGNYQYGPYTWRFGSQKYECVLCATFSD